MLKGQETQPPQEGEINHGLYLLMAERWGAGHCDEIKLPHAYPKAECGYDSQKNDLRL